MEAKEKVSELEEQVLLAKEAHAAEAEGLKEERQELIRVANQATEDMKQVWTTVFS
jgi:hypothetical protein